ncbi:MAG: efflux RND transporter permease subunit [Pseudomonadales bacterium]
MRLPLFAINNRQFTLVLVGMLALLGLLSFLTMPRSEDPQFNFPFTSVVAVYPGTSLLDMEKLVAEPIEEAINELDDVKEIETDIVNGLVTVNVEFLYGSDPDEKYDDVVQAIAGIRDELPADIVRLDAEKISPSNVNILQVALVSETENYGELKRQAEKLERRFERVDGVKKADVWAIPPQEVQIKADLEKMLELGISFEDLVAAVQRTAANIPGGHVDAGGKRLSVTTSGNYTSLLQIKDTVLRGDADHVVYLRDVASVGRADGIATHLARLNGKRAVFVTAMQREGSNIFGVMRSLQQELDVFTPDLPATINVEVAFNQAESVAKQVDGFFINLLQGLIAVGVVVMLALGFRAAGIVMVAIPLSLLVGIGVIDMGGFALQQMSIVGLVIVMGLLVDNAIVVTENSKRYLAAGYSRVDAALKGAQDVAPAVTSGTLTTVLAFLPIALLPNNTGTFLRSMPVTVIVTLFASLLVALAATPLLSSRYLKLSTRDQSSSFEAFSQRYFAPLVQTVLAHPARAIGAALVILLLSIALFPLVGVSMFPDSDKQQFLVDIDLPAGSSLQETNRVTTEIEALLESYPEIHTVATNVGRGNPRIYYNEVPRNESPDFAQLFVQLNSKNTERTRAIVGELRDKTRKLPGARVSVGMFSNGPPIDAPIAIRLVADELDKLRDAAYIVEEIFRDTEGTINVDNPIGLDKLDLHVAINREKAAMLGISLETVDRVVRASLVGMPLSNYRNARGDEYDISVNLAGSDAPSMLDFDHIMVGTAASEQLPLRHIAALELRTEFERFQHQDLQRSALVTSDVLPDYQVTKVTDGIVKVLESVALPKGVRFEISGEQESRSESFAGVLQALIIAVLGIFAVLVLQFRSFIQPLIVFIALPFAFTGAILALFISGNTFSFMAFIGLTSLMGIVVNNSIILVDYTNRLLSGGKAVVDAVSTAAVTRCRPIIITTLTTICSLLPMTLQGSSMSAPLGWVIIGGLLVSTFVSLLVVPALYVLLTPSERVESSKSFSTAEA